LQFQRRVITVRVFEDDYQDILDVLARAGTDGFADGALEALLGARPSPRQPGTMELRIIEFPSITACESVQHVLEGIGARGRLSAWQRWALRRVVPQLSALARQASEGPAVVPATGGGYAHSYSPSP